MRNKKLILCATAAAVALALGIFGGILAAKRKAAPVAVVETPPPPVRDTITLSFGGDCTLGSDPRFSYAGSFHERFAIEGENHAYFFENVRPIFEKDTISFVNFEGTLTESDVRAEKAYTFKGPAHYTEILKAGDIEVVSLANNHTYDFLEEGYRDTAAAMREAEIAYAAGSKYALFAVSPEKTEEVREGREKKADETYIGYAAFSIWYDDGEVRANIKKAIDTLRAGGADAVFMSFHWGLEGEHYPYDVQKAIGRYAIDMGADGVIGHHPHVIQGIEEYKGREIVYSLGNFCFGGNHNPSDKDCFIYQLSRETLDGKMTGAWKSNIIPCRISSRTDRNDYKPTPLSGDAAERILARIEKYSGR